MATPCHMAAPVIFWRNTAAGKYAKYCSGMARAIVSHGAVDLSGYRSLTDHQRSSALAHAPIDSIVISIRYAMIAALITVVVATAAVLVSSRRYGPAITSDQGRVECQQH